MNSLFSIAILYKFRFRKDAVKENKDAEQKDKLRECLAVMEQQNELLTWDDCQLTRFYILWEGIPIPDSYFIPLL